MKYGVVQSLGIFKVHPGGTPVRGAEYVDPGLEPAPLFLPEGENTYFSWKAYLGRPDALLDNHLKTIASVRERGGVLNFGLQPDSGATAAACHQSIQNETEKLHKLFAALQGELAEGLQIVVRYASEMNEFSDKNVYAHAPGAFQDGLGAVIAARDAVAPGVKIAFSPAINASSGSLAGQGNKSIRPYWPGSAGIDVVSCTLYCRPQIASYSPTPQALEKSVNDALKLVMGRANRYFTSDMGAGKALMIDELGGCMRPKAQTVPADGNPAMPPGNDLMLQKMLHRFALGERKIDYATIFLQIEWGGDATLKFIKDANA